MELTIKFLVFVTEKLSRRFDAAVHCDILFNQLNVRSDALLAKFLYCLCARFD